MGNRVFDSKPQTAIGLFAGIGGFEVGFRRAGFHAAMLCETDSEARSVLALKFPEARLVGDVHDLEALPPTDLLAAGFPCADLSQAGRTKGIVGPQSGLIDQVFRLLHTSDPSMDVILENVPFMLSLDHGKAMTTIIERIEGLGFRWAYRIVDTRSFGLPQRRRRVFLFASRTVDPARVLLADDRGLPTESRSEGMAGFYWTEGNRGVGWTDEGVPPLKSGSGLGLASPPAVWLREGDGDRPRFFTPNIRDAEALQGFRRGWTAAAKSEGARWKLVGNAVSVPVAEWLGRRIRHPGVFRPAGEAHLPNGSKWPVAARGGEGQRFSVPVSAWPLKRKYRLLSHFLREDGTPLSQRAAAGFLKRASASSLRFEEGFLQSLRQYVDNAELATQTR